MSEACEKCGAKFGDRHTAECLAELNQRKGRRQRKRAEWPIKSLSYGVHRKQVPHMIEKCKRAGVPTDFTKGGRPIMTSAAHFKAYCRMNGHRHYQY